MKMALINNLLTGDIEMYFDNLEYLVRQSFYLFIAVLEIYGTLIIFLSANSIFFFYLHPRKKREKERGIRLAFAQQLALGLEFLLGAEIIRTVVVRTWNGLIILLIVLLIRALLALLIMWEIRQEVRFRKEYN